MRSFLHSRTTRNTSLNFSTLSSGYFHLSCSTKPRVVFIFSRVLKPRNLDAAFQRRNLWIIFFILLNEHRLNTEKMCGINTLGHTLVFSVIIGNDWFKHHSPLSPNLMVLKKTPFTNIYFGSQKGSIKSLPNRKSGRHINSCEFFCKLHFKQSLWSFCHYIHRL